MGKKGDVIGYEEGCGIIFSLPRTKFITRKIIHCLLLNFLTEKHLLEKHTFEVDSGMVEYWCCFCLKFETLKQWVGSILYVSLEANDFLLLFLSWTE